MPSNIRIIYKSEKRITRQRIAGDPQDKDDTRTTHEIDGFAIVGDDEFHDLTVSYIPEPHRDYYLLLVIYSTGDSFGRRDGEIMFLDLYPEHAAAEKAALTIRSDSDDATKRNYSVEIIAENGEPYKVQAAWKGYFERLEAIEVKALRLNRGTWRY